MYFLSWILVGAVAGWLAGKILKGKRLRPDMDVGTGIGGAIAGGRFMRSAGLNGYNGATATTVVAVVGARNFHSDRRSGERQKDVRWATITVNRHRAFNCRPEIECF